MVVKPCYTSITASFDEMDIPKYIVDCSLLNVVDETGLSGRRNGGVTGI